MFLSEAAPTCSWRAIALTGLLPLVACHPSSAEDTSHRESRVVVSDVLRFGIDDILPLAKETPWGDRNGRLTLLENGQAVCLEGNNWKSLRLPTTYPLTKSAVLEFEFKSTGEMAEINGIGFDDQTQKIPATARTFQIYGSQETQYNTDFAGYTGKGEYQHYRIPLAQTIDDGLLEPSYIFLVNDADAGQATSVCFRNMRVKDEETPEGVAYEPLMPDIKDIVPLAMHTPYGDRGGRTILSSSDRSICLEGNNWKSIRLPEGYALKESSLLEFEFKSTGETAEINGIGFDDQVDKIPATPRGFQIYGTQDSQFTSAYRGYAGKGEYQKYQLPVANVVESGLSNPSYLFLVNDADAGQKTSVCFRNIRLQESTPTNPNPKDPTPIEIIDVVPLAKDTPYGDRVGKMTIVEENRGVCLEGNNWKSIRLHDGLLLQESSVLEFEFKSTGEMAEINGIGFDDQVTKVPATPRGFQIYGPQDSQYNSKYRGYSGQGEYQKYRIPLTDIVASGFVEPSFLFLINDADAGQKTSVCFRNLRVLDDSTPKEFLSFETEKIESYAPKTNIGDRSGSASASEDHRALCMQGNNWKAYRLPSTYPLTEKTMIKFDFKSTGETAEINAIGLETQVTAAPPKGRTIQFFGSQDSHSNGWANGDYFGYDGAGEYQSYQIPIGQAYAEQVIQAFDYIYFVNDADAGQKTSVCFQDVQLFEAEDPADDDSECIPQTCGLRCGQFDDSCNGFINCTCSGELTCRSGRCVDEVDDNDDNPTLVSDRDQDGVPNDYEVLLGTDPDNPDSDGNGITDGNEDHDGDGVTNRKEIAQGRSPLRGTSETDMVTQELNKSPLRFRVWAPVR